MNQPVYSSSSSAGFGYHRPATISELAAQAQDNLWDPTKGLKHWLRTAEKARRNAEALVENGDYERAFVEYAKAATIVLEKLPTHRDYDVLLNADQRHNLGMNGQDILDSLSQLKPVLVDRFEQWQAQQAASASSSRPSTASSYYTDNVSREGSMRQRREDQQEERARHALEAAQREQDWQREEQARRQEEERERFARDESAWAAQHAADSRRRAEEARAERERLAEKARREEEARREDERKRMVDERRRQEQEGIARRQHEAETAALAARMEVATRLSPVPPGSGSSYQTPGRSSEEATTRSIPRGFPVAAPQPARAASSSQRDSLYGTSIGLSVLPLESPTKNDDDSSTDVEGMDQQPWHRSRQTDHTPTKSKHYTSGIAYPPPITTTSPAPPELGLIRYPTLMSQHQLKQGYVPSLQSMFSDSSSNSRNGAPDSSVLFDVKPVAPSYPKPPAPISNPVIPPYPSHMSVSDSHSRSSSLSYPRVGGRGPSPSNARNGPSSLSKESTYSSSRASTATPRIVPSTSGDSVRELKTIRLPRECLPRFLSIARINTSQNKETCGLLLGKDKGNKYVVTTLLIPRQHSTSDTCTMDEEELVLQFTEDRHLITLGWIHTHPTQSCFMSSVDLHTHSGFQRMLPESFAVVCAPTSTPTFGIFRLTDPGGLQTILECTAKDAFHPHPEVPIYTDCDNSHVQMKDMPLEIVDLR